MASKPNIVLFITDDHAAWANSCYGDPHVHTPNLDFLARHGIVMENSFTPTPVCSPARANLFTGRYASQHGIHDYLGSSEEFAADTYWLQHEETLQQLLQQQNYQTAVIGKWHLGQEHISKTGFDYSFTIGTAYPILHNAPRTFYREDQPVYCRGPLTRTITRESLRFLKERNTAQPFLLTVGHYTTHSPWEGHPERLAESYRRKHICSRDNGLHYPFGIQRNESLDRTRYNPTEALCQYYAAVSQIDESVGAVMDELYGQGILDDTLFIYTSDHGLNCGDHGLWGKGNATYPLNMVEQSIRIPLILHSPGRLLGRQRRAEYVNHTDLFQTILAMAGIDTGQLDSGRNYPGRNFLPILTNEQSAAGWENIHYGEYGPVRMVQTPDYKLIQHPGDTDSLLIDLRNDSEELNNLYLDPAYREIRNALIKKIERFFAVHTSDEFDGVKQLEKLPKYNMLEAWDPGQKNSREMDTPAL